MPNTPKPTPESDLATVTAQAKRLGLTGSEKAEYIHKHMTGYGYKSRRTYVMPEGRGSGRSGFFGSGEAGDDDDDDDE